MGVRNLLTGFHNNNYGLQGGSRDQYYHFNKADYESLLSLMGTVVMDDGNLILSNNKQVRFRDSGQAIWSSAADTLDIDTATTLNLRAGGTTRLAMTAAALLLGSEFEIRFIDEYSKIYADGDGFIKLVGFEGVVVSGPAGLKLLNQDDPGSDIYFIPYTGNLALSFSSASRTFRIVHNGSDIFSTSDTLVSSGRNFKIGTGAAGVDYTLTFDGETADGVIVWDYSEELFDFWGHLRCYDFTCDSITKDGSSFKIAVGTDSFFMGSGGFISTSYLNLGSATYPFAKGYIDEIECDSFSINQSVVSGTIMITCSGVEYKVAVTEA